VSGAVTDDRLPDGAKLRGTLHAFGRVVNAGERRQKQAMRIAMMPMTTISSMRVKPEREREREREPVRQAAMSRNDMIQ
jgi:hypothetical protein